ncbi:MAG TPA: FAD-dependent oxidoreductase [Patescibacteria group bacterium]|nr:FAD-dependent oxidoreductase [Patescibacteria group bacterium]
MFLKLIKKRNEAKDTVSFFFEADKPFNWIAGQYIYITLSKLNYPDERGSTRHFTISTSPTEGDLIRITMRIRESSGYKKTLNNLPNGSIVEGKGPQGTFVFDEQIKNNIFLAGGIGITPFRSMIKWNIDRKLNVPIFLIYSNSDSEFVFKNEIDEWVKNNNNIKVEYFDTSESGHLDKTKIENALDGWSLDKNSLIFSVVGPNVFVDAMEDSLNELNIPDSNIKTEKFTGY